MQKRWRVNDILLFCVLRTRLDVCDEEIRANYSKYVVTLDELSTGNIEGVKIIYLADFLLKEELKMHGWKPCICYNIISKFAIHYIKEHCLIIKNQLGQCLEFHFHHKNVYEYLFWQ